MLMELARWMVGSARSQLWFWRWLSGAAGIMACWTKWTVDCSSTEVDPVIPCCSVRLFPNTANRVNISTIRCSTQISAWLSKIDYCIHFASVLTIILIPEILSQCFYPIVHSDIDYRFWIVSSDTIYCEHGLYGWHLLIIKKQFWILHWMYWILLKERIKITIKKLISSTLCQEITDGALPPGIQHYTKIRFPNAHPNTPLHPSIYWIKYLSLIGLLILIGKII